MPLIIRSEEDPVSLGVAQSIADETPERQLAIICSMMAKPVKPETVRRKFLTFWPIISGWAMTRPDLFDAAVYQFVTELEERHASEPDGIRHLREIAKG